MRKINEEIKRFIIAGFAAVSTDLVTYYIMLNFFKYDIAKMLSFFSGSIVAFMINKYWTFEKYKKSYKQIFQFGILYITTLVVNIIVNHFSLYFLEWVFLAFLIATGASTILNFLGQKFWVFK
jgi:putative flippase GtrA